MTRVRAGAAAVLALLLLVVACETGPARLQGRWRGVRAEGVSADRAEAANAFATALELDVRGVSLTVTSGGQRQTGQYRVLREDGSKVVLTTDGDGPLEPQTFTFLDEGVMRWALLPGKAIVLVRQ
jgi:hypothetical protein